jgi:uncharacterized membrane protein (UPF0127 family)
MKILLNIVIAGVIGITILFVYQEYRDDIWGMFVQSDSQFTVYIDNVALSVSVADTQEELERGLSGVTELSEFEGKLFIFPDSQRHGIWMKDMEFAIDVLWFNEKLELIYFQEEVEPSSYPAIFAPPQKARFVVETNAFLIESLQIQKGDRLTLPSSLIPKDVAKILQQ